MHPSKVSHILSNKLIIINLWDDVRKETSEQVGNAWWIPRAQILDNVKVTVDELRISASLEKQSYEFQ